MAIDHSRFTPQQIEVARLLAEPDGTKYTNEDLARIAGVSPSTISAWKRDDDFCEYVNQLTDRYMDNFLPEVYRQLQIKVNQGSVKAIELALKRAGKLREVREVKAEVDMTDTETANTVEEMRREIEELNKRLAGGDA